jgi:hypothetical protein
MVFEDLTVEVMLLNEGNGGSTSRLSSLEVPVGMRREAVSYLTGGLQDLTADQHFHPVFEEDFHLVGRDDVLDHAETECPVIQLLPRLIKAVKGVKLCGVAFCPGHVICPFICSTSRLRERSAPNGALFSRQGPQFRGKSERVLFLAGVAEYFLDLISDHGNNRVGEIHLAVCAVGDYVLSD